MTGNTKWQFNFTVKEPAQNYRQNTATKEGAW